MDFKAPCPFPTTAHYSAGPTPAPSPVLSEFPANVRPLISGSTWNQTAHNKAIGHTFRYGVKECCAVTSATLTLRIKALEGGSGPTSANDGINVYVGGIQIAAQTPWTSSVTTGATKTVTIPLNGNQLTNGMVSFYVQDDTAVISADLDLVICCVTHRP